MEGPRILVGDNPILVGSLVHDLRTESPAAGQQLVYWTQPPGIRRSPPDHKIEYLGRTL